MLNLDCVICITQDGRVVTLREPDDHVLDLKIDGQVIARFSQSGVTIENILKEVKPIGPHS